MKKLLPLLAIALAVLSCSTKPAKVEYKFLDEEYKTFYVNGVSAVEGYSAVIASLQEIGFEMDDITECDLSYVGQGKTFYTVLHCKNPLTSEQYHRLTNGLFVDLPSGDAILEEANMNGVNVFLEWYASGKIKTANIQISRDNIEADAIEINKRLTALFPHSKVSNSRYGYLTYYDDNGVEVYYTDDYFLNMSKK